MPNSHTNFTRDIPRGIATRFLNQQSVPQARWQDPAQLVRSPAVAYDCNRPGAKVLVGAIGERLIGIDDNRHMLTVAGSRAGKSVMLVAQDENRKMKTGMKTG